MFDFHGRRFRVVLGSVQTRKSLIQVLSIQDKLTKSAIVSTSLLIFYYWVGTGGRVFVHMYTRTQTCVVKRVCAHTTLIARRGSVARTRNHINRREAAHLTDFARTTHPPTLPHTCARAAYTHTSTQLNTRACTATLYINTFVYTHTHTHTHTFFDCSD